MTIDLILGIAWFIICCFLLRNVIRGLSSARTRQKISILIPKSDESMFWVIMTGYFVLFLVGIAASVLLLYGVTQARWLIGLAAIAEIFTIGVGIASGDRQSYFNKVVLIVSVVSFVVVLGWATNIFHF